MTDVLIDIIAGARPNFMKIAPLIRAMAASQMKYRLIHTGQHYDTNMSGSFFEQLGIPEPDANLGAGSGTQAEQTAAIMLAYEQLLREAPSNLCLVVGDVTSTMACAIVAAKACIPVAHVEGGIRSGDWSMPEEVNRIVTDSITRYFFTTSRTANENLRQAGVPDDRIHFVGNTMIDTLLANRDRLRAPGFFADAGLTAGGYIVLTLHRPANVDDHDNLLSLLTEITGSASETPVVFPVHPRTAARLGSTKLPDNLLLVEPQPYLEFNYLVANARAVITDSGGVTEEATVLGIPCMTLRNSTERPETVTVGTNELLGTDPAAIRPALEKLFAGKWKKGAIPELWDGRTGERIVKILARELLNG